MHGALPINSGRRSVAVARLEISTTGFGGAEKVAVSIGLVVAPIADTFSLGARVGRATDFSLSRG